MSLIKVECGHPGCQATVEWASAIGASRARCDLHMVQVASGVPTRADIWAQRVPAAFRDARIEVTEPSVQEAALAFVDVRGIGTAPRDGRPGGRGAIIIGPSGVGKTTLAYGVTRALVSSGAIDPRRIIVGTEAQIMDPVYGAKFDGDRAAALRHILPPPSAELMLLDDLGQAMARGEVRARALHALFDHLVTEATGVRLLVTTNYTLDGLREALGVPVFRRLMVIVGRRVWCPGDVDRSSGRRYNADVMGRFVRR